jgi:hypothetical protein
MAGVGIAIGLLAVSVLLTRWVLQRWHVHLNPCLDDRYPDAVNAQLQNMRLVFELAGCLALMALAVLGTAWYYFQP